MTEQTDRPRLLIVAGPNGSGKTTVTERGLAHTWFDGCEYINPDLIARDQFGDWNAPEAVLSAAREAQRLREVCLADRRSLAFETIANCAEVAREVDRLYLYDNTVDNADATLIVRAADGAIERKYRDVLPWMVPIVATLEGA
jgi:predicted ABC-type ATPase